MAESVNGGGSNPGQSPKEMSMEMRLLLAFLLMGAVMWVTPYFFKAQNPTPAKKTAQTETPVTASSPPTAGPDAAGKAGQASPDTTSTVPVAEASEPAEAPASATPQKQLPNLTIETDLYKVTFSNQGGNVRSWQLKKYRGNDNKLLDLVNSSAGLDFP